MAKPKLRPAKRAAWSASPERSAILREALYEAAEAGVLDEAMKSLESDQRVLNLLPSTVYRLFDSDGSLLYVGITNSGHRRLKEHGKAQSWWTNVAGAKFEHFPDRQAALDHEAQLIRTLRPKHNMTHNHDLPDRRDAVLERMVKRNQLPPQCYEPIESHHH